MKKVIYLLVLTILVLYILFFPGPAIRAASFGLVLWYTKLLPSLLPFAILSYIFVASGLIHSLTGALHKILRHLLPLSSAAVYPLLAGFLFGFPLGSCITAQLVVQGDMDYAEGNRLFSVCNNISPVFINGFILHTTLKRPDLGTLTLLILYLPPLIYFILDTRFSSRKRPGADFQEKKAAPRSQINFKIIDAGIMSGFETLTRLGGYILLFAILAEMIKSLPLPGILPACLLAGLMELTNGIVEISALRLPFDVKYLLVIVCTAFGGLSGLAQTASMTREAGFSMGKYIKTKVILSLASSMLAFLAVKCHLL